MPESVICNVALKEWAITCEALSQGRQIMLLRKGGLLDEDGTFCLEHGQFFLLPTYLHQEKALVQPQHHDLFRAARRLPQETLQVAFLRHFARVEAIWQLRESDFSLLEAAPHIWSQQYLEMRFSYQSEKPLLCAALRVWELELPLRYELRAQDMGCRSWVEMEKPLESAATPVLSDEEFGQNLDELELLFR